MIPKRLTLAGLDIDITLDPKLYEIRKILGEAQYPQQNILLDDSGIMSKDTSDQNYFHELVHFILYVMSEDELRCNEKFVETFAYNLHQALKTSEYHEQMGPIGKHLDSIMKSMEPTNG
jgi:hypothetical protein